MGGKPQDSAFTGEGTEGGLYPLTMVTKVGPEIPSPAHIAARTLGTAFGVNRTLTIQEVGEFFREKNQTS